MCTPRHVFALVVLLMIWGAGAQQAPTVTVQQGKLRGHRIQTISGKNILAFRGVPYAKPPIGDLRFHEPQPLDTWEGVRDAREDGKACTQKDFIFMADPQLEGSEDCLYLNVYTTKLAKPGGESEQRAVMFYIHGGGWQSGHGGMANYGPQYLLDHEIILVTINYRLGALGFLSTEDVESPGNYGLKDQLAALHWVRNNIAQFGGDPERVTIFGQSAGGASVHYHLLSPLSNGLFRAAISMSGTAFAPWASARNAAQSARKLARLLDCPEEPSKALVNCLRTKEAAQLVEAYKNFMEWNIDPLLVFNPSVEPPHPGQRFLPAHTLAMVRESERLLADRPVPWMTGLTSEDGSMRSAVIVHNTSVLESLNSNFEDVAPISLRFRESAEDPLAAARQIRKFYFGDKPIDKTTIPQITELYTDRHNLVPITEAVEAMRVYGSERPIFLYQFSHRGLHSLTTHLDPGSDINYGVCHLDELQYLFSMPTFYPALPSDPAHADHIMMRFTTRLFADFAITGNPTPEPEQPTIPGKNETMVFIWHPIVEDVSRAGFADLRADDPRMRLMSTLHSRGVAFWESLKLLENGRPASSPTEQVPARTEL